MFNSASLSEAEAEQLQYDWSFYARPNQLLLPGDWLTWLLLAGRGFGKTRAAAEAVGALVCGPTPLQGTEYGHIAIVAETAADARDVCVEGESGILGAPPPPRLCVECGERGGRSHKKLKLCLAYATLRKPPRRRARSGELAPIMQRFYGNAVHASAPA
jgi:hypothetical protein